MIECVLVGDFQMLIMLVQFLLFVLMYFGMFLFVVCVEDVFWIDLMEIVEVVLVSIFGKILVCMIINVCKVWLQVEVLDLYYELVRLSVLIFVFFGRFDLVMLFVWGELILDGFSDVIYFVVFGVGYGVVFRICMEDVIIDFFVVGIVNGFDIFCVEMFECFFFFLIVVGMLL